MAHTEKMVFGTAGSANATSRTVIVARNIYQKWIDHQGNCIC